MSDLEGDDAFERVLDRMVAAEVRSAEYHARVGGLESRVRDVERENRELHTRLANLSGKLKGNEDQVQEAFYYLYQTAKGALGHMPSDSLAYQQLVAALDEALPLITHVPF